MVLGMIFRAVLGMEDGGKRWGQASFKNMERRMMVESKFVVSESKGLQKMSPLG